MGNSRIVVIDPTLAATGVAFVSASASFGTFEVTREAEAIVGPAFSTVEATGPSEASGPTEATEATVDGVGTALCPEGGVSDCFLVA